MVRKPTLVNVLLFDAFSNHCLANLVEPLRAANTLSRQTLYEWRLLTLSGRAVVSSSGIQITPEDALGTHSGDVLAVMPSFHFDKYDTHDTSRALIAAARRHAVLAGLDTGPWLLARAGLLDGHQATIHWEEHSRFEEAFPNVEAQRARYVASDNRWTCSGAMAAFDMMSALIARDHGPLLAMEVGQYFLSAGPAPAVQPMPLTPRGSSGKVKRAVEIMQAHLEAPLPIPSIARQIGCSQKSLETAIRSDLQTSPQGLYRKLRLNLARKLVTDSDLSIAEITARAGYENASAMTRAFRQEFGVAPRKMRAQV